jgi:hypothetical protein
MKFLLILIAGILSVNSFAECEIFLDKTVRDKETRDLMRSKGYSVIRNGRVAIPSLSSRYLYPTYVGVPALQDRYGNPIGPSRVRTIAVLRVSYSPSDGLPTKIIITTSDYLLQDLDNLVPECN